MEPPSAHDEVVEQPAHSCDAATANATNPLLSLPREVLRLILRQLTSIEWVLLRGVCKLAAELLAGCKSIQLSQPVPEWAFAAKWGQPDAVRDLTFRKREQLMCLTAQSGVAANLRLLAVGPFGKPGSGAAGVQLTDRVFAAAAAAGQLAMCELLKELGCPSVSYNVRMAAANAGHIDVVRLLEQTHCGADKISAEAAAARGHAELCMALLKQRRERWTAELPGTAARSGNLGLTRQLLQLSEQSPQERHTDAFSLLTGAMYGLDLATFEARWMGETHVDMESVPAASRCRSPRGAVTAHVPRMRIVGV
jgi:hypothetical protein